MLNLHQLRQNHENRKVELLADGSLVLLHNVQAFVEAGCRRFLAAFHSSKALLGAAMHGLERSLWVALARAELSPCGRRSPGRSILLAAQGIQNE